MSATAPPRLYAIVDLDFCGGLPAWRTCIARLGDAARRFPNQIAIQVRARGAADAVLAEIARVGRDSVGEEALLVLNGPDRLAVELGYDGVHWPETAIPDQAPSDDSPAIRFAAVHSVAAIRRAERANAAAVVFAPVFEPGWKAARAAGLPALQGAAAATPLPVLALGGIRVEHVPACLAAGAHGVAVLSGIAGDPDPRGATGRYLDALG